MRSWKQEEKEMDRKEVMMSGKYAPPSLHLKAVGAATQLVSRIHRRLSHYRPCCVLLLHRGEELLTHAVASDNQH